MEAIVFLIFVLVFASLIYAYIKWSFLYWKKRNIPYLDPCFPYGNRPNLLRDPLTFGIIAQTFYNELKSRGHKHGGIYVFTKPIYFVIDPEYARNICVRDYAYFERRSPYFNERDWITVNMFNTHGDHWKAMRSKMSPAFNTTQLKTNEENILRIIHILKNDIDKNIHNSTPVDIFKVSSYFASDLIASYAFGMDVNSFENTNTDFHKYTTIFFRPSSLYLIRLLLSFVQPELSKKLNIQYCSEEIRKYYTSIIKDVIKSRDRTDWLRKDVLQIFLDVLKQKDCEITLKNIIAESLVIFVAGAETNALSLAYGLFELANNQFIQDKLREEIEEICGKNNITFELVNKMQYLHQIFEEILRKHPPIHFIPRLCTKDFVFPDTNICLGKGTVVVLPVLGLHRDPEYYPEPDKFDPDRFAPENRHKMNPLAYVPFGQGIRMCPGEKLAKLVVKSALAEIIKNYHVTINKNTKLPFEYQKYSLLIIPKDPVLLDFEHI